MGRSALDLRIGCTPKLKADLGRIEADITELEGTDCSHAHAIETFVLLWRDAQKRGVAAQFVRNQNAVARGF